MNEDKRILSRPVEATLIPQGTPMELAEGENVVITHRLGRKFYNHDGKRYVPN
jgi:hypothetical protein